MEKASDRSFGIVFGFIFAVIALYPLIDRSTPNRPAIALSIFFFLFASVFPKKLAPLNRAWHRFGIIMGKITNPILLALFYYGMITPIGLMLRLFGKNPLKLRYDSQARSYWVSRPAEANPNNSLKNQF